MKTILLSLCAVLAPLAAAAAAASPTSKAYPADQIKAVVVETSGGPIALTADDKQASVDVAPPAKPGEDCRVTQSLSGGVLTLTAKGGPDRGFLARFGGLSSPCSAGFAATLPARAAVTARSGSGKIDVGAFSGKIDVKTGSGAVELHGAAGPLVLRSGSGTVSGDAGGQKNVDVETGSGGIDLRELTGSVSARSGSGFVSLMWAAAPQAGDIAVRTGSGGFTAILPKDAKLSVSMNSGSGKTSSEFSSDAAASLHLVFRGGSGDAQIKKAL